MKSLEDILQMANNVQAELARAQEGLDRLEVEGASGGGMVKVRASAKGRIIRLDIDPDEDSPSATLSAIDGFGDERARVSVSPAFKLTRRSAQAWAESGFRKPSAG